ncbi:dna repair protein sae2 [Diplodia corticola]|uniref:Dna repair protein sae2 n=1 Tax=Diplodia corticola TaxID=236234 RepID=A0A1J9RUG2_9PEZI|nr:dna repair protein sae2 [Diplodia corticola]OJD31492.1 dna repair protein sae2 [Diplodia corticola]
MEEKPDEAALQWLEVDDTDGAIERHSAILQQNIRTNNLRHQNEKRALERNNTELLVRLQNLEREHEELKCQLEAAIQASTSAAPQTKPLSTTNTSAPPRSSATVSTQEATVPFHEHKELERMYHVVLRENDGLRINSERLAKQHDVMKGRVKEWSTWASKERERRRKDRRENATEKSVKSSLVDMDRPPTPMSNVSQSSKAQPTPEHGLEPGDMHKTIVEQAFHFLEHHESPLRGASAAADLPETILSDGHQLPDELPQTYHVADIHAALQQQQHMKDLSKPQRMLSSQQDQVQAPSHSRNGSLRLTSSQTTQDVDDDHENMQDAGKHVGQHHSSDDEPTIVSERSLKRRHPSHVQVHQDSVGRQSGPSPHVKAEPSDTQATAPAVPALLNRVSTLDLDAMGIQIQTPRKRRRMQDAIDSSQLQGEVWAKSRPALLRERSSSLPLDFPQKTGSAKEAKLEAHDKAAIYELPDSDPSPTAEEQDDPLGSATAILTRSPDNPRKASALRSRDVNIQPRPRLETFSALRPRRRGDENRGAKAVPMLSEDGEDTEIRELSPLKMQESDRRFAELYENPPPARKALKSPRTPAPNSATRASPRSTVAKRRDAATPKLRKAAAQTSSKKHLTPQPLTPQTGTRTPNSTRSLRQRQRQQAPSVPLRTKTISDLNLSDFKINPNANAGLDFAFTEVVRNHDVRRCLPGCTKYECCGRELHGMVRAGLKPPLPHSFWENSQSQQERPFINEQEAEDHRYLGWFMGSGYSRDRVDAMPIVQREDLVVQAKVKLLANQVGRHRNAHERSRTPPGFWRVDFPGTQEREKDKEEAQRREREVVEERWREAMTEGGRWKFVDE